MSAYTPATDPKSPLPPKSLKVGFVVSLVFPEVLPTPKSLCTRLLVQAPSEQAAARVVAREVACTVALAVALPVAVVVALHRVRAYQRDEAALALTIALAALALGLVLALAAVVAQNLT